MKKCITIVLLLLLACWPVAGQGIFPMTVTDSAGREVTFDRPVERIIVLNSDAAEAVVMLGDSDKVVGVSNTILDKSYYFPSLKGKQSVGKWNEPDYELIGEIALNGGKEIVPDILVISYSYPDKPYGIFGVEKGLEPFGNIKVLGLDFYKPENMTSEVAILGSVLGREAAASDYISWYQDHTDAVNTAIMGLSRPVTYVEWTAKGTDLSTMAEGSGFDSLLRMAGGINAAQGLGDPYPKVDWEWVVSENPAVIIKRSTQKSSEGGMGWIHSPSVDSVGLENSLNEVLNRAAAKSVSAVKGDRVYICNWEVMAGLDDVVGLTYLAKLLHPETNLDPREVHSQYLERIGLEMSEDRIFVYPEP